MRNKEAFRHATALCAGLSLWLLCTPVPAGSAPAAIAERSGLESPTLSFNPEVVPQVGHSQEIQDVLFAPDGTFIVTAARDNKIKIWTVDGRLLRTIQPQGTLPRIALSADSRLIAAVSGPGFTELWKVTGERAARFPQIGGAMMGAVAFSPDSTFLVACNRSSKDDFCQVFDLQGTHLAVMNNPAKGQSSVKKIAVSPDAGIIYTLAARHLYRWSPQGALLGKFEVCDGWAQTIAASPDGSLLATACAEQGHKSHSTAIWTAEGKLVKRFASHDPGTLEFSADGQWLLSGGDKDNRLNIYNRAGNLLQTLQFGRDTDGSPAHLAVSPDKRLIAVADHHFKPVNLGLWTTEGEPVRRFNNYNTGILGLAVADPADVVVTTASDGLIRYWSLDGRLLKHYSSGYDYPSLLAIAPSGRFLVTGGTEVTLWSADGKKLAREKVNSTGGRSLAIDPEGRLIITGDADGHLTLIPLQQGAKAKRFKPHDGHPVDAIAIHPDGQLFATGSIWERFRIWDLDGEMKGSFAPPPDTKPPFSSSYAMEFTPDGKQLIVATTRPGRELAIYDLAANEIGTIATGNRDGQGDIAISSDGRLLAASVGSAIGVWDLATRKPLRLFRGHGARVGSLAFANENRHLVSGHRDGLMKVWRLDTGASISLLANRDDWIIFTDDGYFDSSRHGGDLIAIVDGMNAYGIDQLAVQYNRPDIIYERLGLGSREFLDHFRTYVNDRLRKFRLQPGGQLAVSTPKVHLKTARQKDKAVEVEFEASDSAGLKEVQIFVNNVPLFSGPGRPVDGKIAIISERVELTEGKNKIEVTARNLLGIEAMRVPAFAEYRQPTRGALYFVGLGVSRYRDPSRNLQFAHKDVLDFSELLIRYGNHFEKVHSMPLTDEHVSRKALPRISDFLAGAGVDDTVIMLVSGHGGYDLGSRGTYYFLPHEGDPDNLPETAIAYQDLEGLLSGIAPRRKLLLLDTCASGALDPTVASELQARAQGAGLLARTAENRTEGAASGQRPYLLTRDRYIYNDLDRRSGSIVLSSSLASELSLESPEMKNGVFTAAVIAALTDRRSDTDGDRTISFEELETAVKVRVISATGAIQHPTVDRDNSYQRFRLPVLE